MPGLGVLLGCLCGFLALLSPAVAVAAPVAHVLSTAGGRGSPLIAYDPATSTTYVAWTYSTTPSGSLPQSDSSSAIYSADGVYAIWDTSLNLELDYSADGGKTWGLPTVIPPPSGLPEGSGPGDAGIVGTGGGTVELAYTDGTEQGSSQAQDFIESINYQALQAADDAVTVTTTQAAGRTTGTSLTVAAGTVDEEDIATLSGIDTPTAVGNVTYGLYSTPSCTAASEVFKAGTKPVSDGLAMPSGPVTAALASGTYYWMDSYSGDAHDTAATSPCGSEVLTISPASSTTPAASNKPTISGAGLSGLADNRPTFVFAAAKAAKGSSISSVTIILPAGLGFVKVGLKKGLTLSGAKIKRDTLHGDKLTITFKSGAGKIKVSISDKALTETGALESRVKRHKVASLTLSVITKAGTTNTTQALRFTKFS